MLRLWESVLARRCSKKKAMQTMNLQRDWMRELGEEKEERKWVTWTALDVTGNPRRWVLLKLTNAPYACFTLSYQIITHWSSDPVTLPNSERVALMKHANFLMTSDHCQVPYPRVGTSNTNHAHPLNPKTNKTSISWKWMLEINAHNTKVAVRVCKSCLYTVCNRKAQSNYQSILLTPIPITPFKITHTNLGSHFQV